MTGLVSGFKVMAFDGRRRKAGRLLIDQGVIVKAADLKDLKLGRMAMVSGRGLFCTVVCMVGGRVLEAGRSGAGRSGEDGLWCNGHRAIAAGYVWLEDSGGQVG